MNHQLASQPPANHQSTTAPPAFIFSDRASGPYFLTTAPLAFIFSDRASGPYFLTTRPLSVIFTHISTKCQLDNVFVWLVFLRKTCENT